MGRVVGIDYGRARIGLAISDERRIIAQPLETVKTVKNPKETAKLIAKTLSSYKNIDAVVMGLPLMLSGQESEMSKEARVFAKLVEEVLGLPVQFWDERLTSSGVDRMLRDADLSRKKRAQLSDALAAVSILQNYLDSLCK